MILISDFIRKGDNGEMKNKLKFPDTPWHIEYTKKAEDDPRRHKARCIYIEGDICHCGYDKYFLSKCGGSSHCNHYSETSIEDEEMAERSNRTFMELKFDNISFQDLLNYSSNRTFMELKLQISSSFTPGIVSSNRTFMELKLKK